MNELVLLMTVHFIADFILQNDWMATNKSKRWDALALHVAIYAACFVPWGLPFVLKLGALHFVTDAITSRVTSYLWQKQARHWFFVVIGFDQWLHMVQLAWLVR